MISFNWFLCDFFIVIIRSYHLQNRDNFTSSIPVQIFSWSFTLVSASRNTEWWCEESSPSSGFWSENEMISNYNIKFDGSGILFLDCIRLGSFCLFLIFEHFYDERILHFATFLCIYWDNAIYYFLSSKNILLGLFLNVEPPFNPMTNITCASFIIFLINCWIQFDAILLRISASNSKGIIVNSFLVIVWY